MFLVTRPTRGLATWVRSASICAAAGLDPRGAEPIRLAENETWRLPAAGVIVRLFLPDRRETAVREVRVARWLADNGVRAVVPFDTDQPVEHGGRVAMFWHEIPPHSHGSIADVALALTELHAITPPTFDIGALDPFVRVRERLSEAGSPPRSDADSLTFTPTWPTAGRLASRQGCPTEPCTVTPGPGTLSGSTVANGC
ncbi:MULTISPECIES: phosphotransferase [Streptomyces]|uniref:phosphotransferase n=1 Tax=Streptomyces TaxID=1883 RepID=UPI0029AD74A6|nr:phosphotransferase [Streptomyces sp. ID05-18]MDX3485009.1 phosphotransferase [Streptomyces sp. ID05-18]